MSAGSPPQPWGVFAVSGVCFLALTAAVVALGAFPADTALRDALLGLATPAMVEIMRVVNRAGEWPVLLPGTIALLVVSRQARQRWWVWTGLMATAPIVEGVLKHLVGRPRPEDLSLGFPSGHSTAAAAFFGAVVFLSGALPPATGAVVRGVSVVMIGLVGLARVLLRAHWPSDVLGGIALGLALAAAAGLLASRPSPPPGAR